MKITFKNHDGHAVCTDVSVDSISSVKQLRALAAAVLGAGWTTENTRLIIEGKLLTDDCERHSHYSHSSSFDWKQLVGNAPSIYARMATATSPSPNNRCPDCEQEEREASAWATRQATKPAYKAAEQQCGN